MALCYNLICRDFDGSVGKSLPAKKGDVGSIHVLGRHLEEEMAIYSSILAWKVPSTEKFCLGLHSGIHRGGWG